MQLLDVNVVLAAHRDDHPHYHQVRPWFDALVAGDEAFTVPTLVWGSFLRLATNRRVFPIPTPRADAFQFIHAVQGQPHHIETTAGPRHVALLERIADEGDAVGNLIPDVVVAALAAEHDSVVVTLDRDFARFRSVRHLLLAGTAAR